MSESVLRNNAYQAAGHVWRVPSVRIIRLRDGSSGIPEVEIGRIHRGIANELCGSEEALDFAELEFLADLTATTLTEVARVVGLHKSTVSKWREAGGVPSDITSNILKRFFWHRIFGAVLAEQRIPLEATASDRALLHYMHDQAVLAHLADPVVRVAA
jgi:hypothetical protein